MIAYHLRGVQERRDRVELLGVAVLGAARHARPREADAAPDRVEPRLEGEAGAQVLGLRLAAVELCGGNQEKALIFRNFNWSNPKNH